MSSCILTILDFQLGKVLNFVFIANFVCFLIDSNLLLSSISSWMLVIGYPSEGIQLLCSTHIYRFPHPQSLTLVSSGLQTFSILL